MRRRLKEKLSTELSAEELRQIYNSFDIVGDIAILKLAKGTAGAEAAAKQIMATHRGVKTVLAQTSAVRGDFRVRTLKLVTGVDRAVTRYREAGCVFAVDVERCYFSPRLSFERMRIARLVHSGETVVNMFAGVGCFSVIIAKSAPQTTVYSIDISPAAVKYMEENVRVNDVYGKVIPILGDAKEAIKAQLVGRADRVLMPLPEKAIEYLPYAISALKPAGGWLHIYDFQHAARHEKPCEKTKLAIAKELEGLGAGFDSVYCRVVRSTGPNWYQTVLDVHINGVPSNF